MQAAKLDYSHHCQLPLGHDGSVMRSFRVESWGQRGNERGELGSSSDVRAFRLEDQQHTVILATRVAKAAIVRRNGQLSSIFERDDVVRLMVIHPTEKRLTHRAAIVTEHCPIAVMASEQAVALDLPRHLLSLPATQRSEERRVGKECRSRWWPDHEKEKEQ